MLRWPHLDSVGRKGRRTGEKPEELSCWTYLDSVPQRVTNDHTSLHGHTVMSNIPPLADDYSQLNSPGNDHSSDLNSPATDHHYSQLNSPGTQ